MEPTEQECRHLVERIVASKPFQRAFRLRAFLLYVTDCALSNRPGDLIETAIGQRVFGRPAGYNPAEDNIVRSEARHLRARLSQYFATDGRNEAIILEMPKGAYVPAFRSRPEVGYNETAATTQGNGALAETWRRYALWAVTATLGVLCLVLWSQNRTLHAMLASGSPSSDGDGWLCSQMFSATHQTTVVVADSSTMELQDIAQRRLNLEQYLNLQEGKWEHPNPDLSRVLQRTASRQLTSMADVVITAGIVQIGQRYSDRPTMVKFARKIDLRDFKGNNHAILLGSPRSNPWVELFESSMNFRFEYDPSTNISAVRNLAPREGEAPEYRAIGRENVPGDSFGVIAFHPNLTREGNVLIIAGATMEGTEAAGEFVVNPRYSTLLADALDRNGIERGHHFEALIRTRCGAGTSRDTTIVSCRRISGRRIRM